MLHRILIAILTTGAVLACQALTSSPGRAAPVAFTDLSSVHQLATAYSPDQIQTAYDFKPLYNRGIDGTGQTVALIELDSYDPADLQQFDQAYNLPDPSIIESYVGGQNFVPGNDLETTMDLEWVHALAPGAAIHIYYLNSHESMAAGWRDMAQALRSATSAGATSISISLGACGPSNGASATKAAFAAVERLGVTAFVSSGDTGAYPGPRKQCGSKIRVGYPTGDPSVVSVGGTSLDLNDDATILAETAWRLSGGGRITKFVRPSWEVASTMPKDRYRWAPDVAFLGDQNTGVSVYGNGSWHQAAGTSLGAPAWAALWVLVRQSVQQAGGTVGAAPPILYRIGNSGGYAQAFHDITSGGNGHYRAGVGWDAVTGWGTPNAAGLAGAIQAIRLQG